MPGGNPCLLVPRYPPIPDSCEAGQACRLLYPIFDEVRLSLPYIALKALRIVFAIGIFQVDAADHR